MQLAQVIAWCFVLPGTFAHLSPCLVNPVKTPLANAIITTVVLAGIRKRERKGRRQRLNGPPHGPLPSLPKKKKTVSNIECYHPRHVSLLTQIGQSFYGVQPIQICTMHQRACTCAGPHLLSSTHPFRSPDVVHVHTYGM
jgi:hypothetical protein